MKNKILKILEQCKSLGYDDLHFETDREYIANAIIKMFDDICENTFKKEQDDGKV